MLIFIGKLAQFLGYNKPVFYTLNFIVNIMLSKLKKIVKQQYFLPVFIFLFTLLTHAVNVFNFPGFLGDEGIYSFQGWWLLDSGKLSPYTYWYDHFPFGWFLIGLWQKLTGGPFTFGLALNSGRVFMVILASLTNIFIFKLVNLLTRDKRIAFVSSLIFALSPLAITYHRQILLDNIETFFLVLSLFTLFKAKKRAAYFLLSGIFFGLSFLSKEIVVFLLPSIVLTVLWQTKGSNKIYLLFLWFASAVFLMILFPILALIKGEFFPSSWFSQSDHVSFLETVIFQLSRGTDLRPWQKGSYFYRTFAEWLRVDFLFILLGLWSIVANFFVKFKKKFLSINLICLNYLAFLARGGFILGFYFIPLIALFSINIGLALKISVSEFKFLYKFKKLVYPLIGILALILFYLSFPVFVVNEVDNQKNAINYIKNNLSENSVVVVDDFAFLDLRLKRNDNDKAFINAEWYSKVENDPEVRYEKFYNNWKNIDYLMYGYYIREQTESGNLPFIKKIYDNSMLLKEFTDKGGVDIYLYKVKKD
jgi:hypothetical protein